MKLMLGKGAANLRAGYLTLYLQKYKVKISGLKCLKEALVS